MKKMIILATIMMVTLTGCGSKEEVVKETENNGRVIEETVLTEQILTETVLTENLVSEEYLREVEYNSKHNVYFGED